MVCHVVLFRPKSDLTSSERDGMMTSLAAAASDIPSVRRFRIGKRIAHAAQYEQFMRDDFPYFALVEFDDLAGLQAYLRHPKHGQLGVLFYRLQDAALAYDYEVEPLS